MDTKSLMQPHDKNGHAVDTDGVPVHDSLCSVCNPIYTKVEKGCCEKCRKVELVLRLLVKGGGYPSVSCSNSLCPCHTQQKELSKHERGQAIKYAMNRANDIAAQKEEGKKEVLTQLREAIESKKKKPFKPADVEWELDSADMGYNTALQDILAEISKLTT